MQKKRHVINVQLNYIIIGQRFSKNLVNCHIIKQT